MYTQYKSVVGSKPEVDIRFIVIIVLDLVGKGNQIVNLLPLNGGYNDFKYLWKTESTFGKNRKSAADFLNKRTWFGGKNYSSRLFIASYGRVLRF